MGRLWTCPYCNRNCTIDDNDERILSSYGYIAKEYGYYEAVTDIIVCPNSQCRELTIYFGIRQTDEIGNVINGGEFLYTWQLKPESQAKPFPNYIPKQLLADYKEACLIRDKSPKASATLSRRCLQGMISDFWKIKKGRLVDQINALQDKVDNTTWLAIDSVRKIGNIGAHMEKDVNLIIDVEPEEANLLIGLLETLFEEWYIAHHDREAKMNALINTAKKKEVQKNHGSAPDTK